MQQIEAASQILQLIEAVIFFREWQKSQWTTSEWKTTHQAATKKTESDLRELWSNATRSGTSNIEWATIDQSELLQFHNRFPKSGDVASLKDRKQKAVFEDLKLVASDAELEQIGSRLLKLALLRDGWELYRSRERKRLYYFSFSCIIFSILLQLYYGWPEAWRPWRLSASAEQYLA